MAVPERAFVPQRRGIMRSVRETSGFALQASDGRIGEATDFYFDDVTWTLRYLVADTGGWLTGRQVLLSPSAIVRVDWRQKLLFFDLTRQQIKDSPGIAADKPVSRQHQLEMSNYFGWTPYWIDGMYPTVPPLLPVSKSVREEIEKQEQGDPHLRSCREVLRYDIRAVDGLTGSVNDFLADDRDWIIRYLVAATRDWLPGKKVLLPVTWIQDIDWAGGRISVDLAGEKIRKAPEYTEASNVTPEYEEKLLAYYNPPSRRG